MENARLLTEQREALEQQTATAEVLQVINASPGDLAPVFDAMLEKAMRLCEAAFGALFVSDGDVVRLARSRNVPADFKAYLEREPPRLDAGSLLSRAMREQTVLNVADLRETPPFRDGVSLSVAAVELAGIRSICWVPLIHETHRTGPVRDLPPRGAAVLRQADGAVAELRRPGGDRDGERAADHRAARGAGAADRDRRGVAGDQRLARRSGAGVRCDAGKGDAPVRCGVSAACILYDGEHFRRRVAERAACPDEVLERTQPADRAAGWPACWTAIARRRRCTSSMHARTIYRDGDASAHGVDSGGARTMLFGAAAARTRRCLGHYRVYRQEVRRSPTSRSRCWRISPPRR